MFGELSIPDYLAVGSTQAGWTTIDHNSFNMLHDWAFDLSSEFNCRVIVTMAQSVSDVYYWALYEKGIKLREIEVCYSDDSEQLNWGERLSFEGDRPGLPSKHLEEGEYLFDFDAIEHYCAQYGLKIQVDYNQFEWFVLRKNSGQPTVTDYIDKHLKPKKPWWRFW